jgi:hypothetical protein
VRHLVGPAIDRKHDSGAAVGSMPAHHSSTGLSQYVKERC